MDQAIHLSEGDFRRQMTWQVVTAVIEEDLLHALTGGIEDGKDRLRHHSKGAEMHPRLEYGAMA